MYYSEPLETNESSDTSQLRDKFDFRLLDDNDCYASIMSLKSNSLGSDYLSAKFLKLCTPPIIPIVTHLFNEIIRSGVYPALWKVSKVICIPKVGLPNSPLDYRPITILSPISKALEFILDKQIKEYLHETKLISDRQSGFRSGFSTTTVLTDVSEFVRHALDVGNCVILALLDFSKAFNTIKFDIMRAKLDRCYRFSSNASRLIDSYLTNRYQYVELDDISSGSLSLSSGVPQGSILGPLIFSLYINDILAVIKSCHAHLFADDLQIFYEISMSGSTEVNVKRAFEFVNADLVNIDTWATNNGLRLNSSKSKSIIFGTRTSLSKLPSPLPILSFNGTESLEFCSSVRDLGLIFTQTLDWSDHIDKVCSSMFFTLRSLYLHSSYTPRKVRLLLVKSLVLSQLFYCDIIFTYTNSKNFKKIQAVYNSCLRYIYGLRKRDHISSFANSIYGCSLKQYLDLRLLIFMFKLINYKAPTYLYERINFSSSKRTMNVNISQHSTAFMDGSVLSRGAKLWNKLPNELKNVDQLSLFRRLCERDLVEQDNGC